MLCTQSEAHCLFTLRLQTGRHCPPAEGWLFITRSPPRFTCGSLANADTPRLRVRFQGFYSILHQFSPKPCPSSSSLLTSQNPGSGEQLADCLSSCLSGWVFSFPPEEARVEKVGGSTHCGVSAQCAHSAHILSIPGRKIISFSYRGKNIKGPKGTATFSKERYLIYHSSLVHSALVKLQPGVGTCGVVREQTSS